MAFHDEAWDFQSIGGVVPYDVLADRTTIAAALYPNDTKHLALWIKNARYMKPGSAMPTLGAFQRDPYTKTTVPKTGLSDQQIADIVAYLQALK